jgi:glycosyltransferase involved in cell wall biosynthesis
MIKVSLIICVYNGADYIDRAIRSCLNQVLIGAKIEVIVVNDGSTDSTKEVCENFRKSINYIELPLNVGISAASNIAIKNSKYDYYMRVDSDDFLNQLAVMHMSTILESNMDIDFVVCDHIRVDNFGQKTELVRLNSDHMVYRHGAGILFRRSIVDKVGLYDESIRNCEDFDLLARMLILHKSKYFYMPIALYRYYIHGENLTSNPDRALAWKFVASRYGLDCLEL